MTMVQRKPQTEAPLAKQVKHRSASVTGIDLFSIHVAQLVFIARWETTGAPKTCKVFASLLPMTMKLIHCSWSGEGVWIPLGKWEKEWHEENQIRHPAPGQLLLHIGRRSEPELLIPCGSCSFRSKFGPLSGNHFATVIQGTEDLLELHRLLLWHGAQDCTIEAIGCGEESRAVMELIEGKVERTTQS